MSKEKQFEHIENKIKQAIENNQPVFDENAWDKMEALLDKEEKNPKPLYWVWLLLPLLLVGAGSAYFYNYKKSHIHLPENIAKGSTGKTAYPSKNPEVLTDGKVDELLSKKNNEETLPNTGLIKDPLVQKSNPQLKEMPGGTQLKINKSKTIAVGKRENITIDNAHIIKNSKSFNDKGIVKIIYKGKTKIKTSENEAAEEAVIIEKKAADKNVPTEIKKTDADSSSQLTAKSKKKTDVDITQDKKQPPLKPQNKLSPFYLLASFGADIGSVKLFSFSNSSLGVKYGVGIGYQLNNKLSLQTGFYTGKKKYVAGPDDYHVKEHSYLSYVKITKVDAACTVYEIPLSVRYEFLHKASVSYYATVGMSSYLMKKEDYNYYYMRYNMPQEIYYTYTGNTHFLSTLSLSAGIEKKISSRLSLQLEPSVSIPLSGVGDGKVKLYSTALVLGVKYLPFKK